MLLAILGSRTPTATVSAMPSCCFFVDIALRLLLRLAAAKHVAECAKRTKPSAQTGT